jgi:hypothetical protein
VSNVEQLSLSAGSCADYRRRNQPKSTGMIASGREDKDESDDEER